MAEVETHERWYASNGKGNLGVTLGAIGTGLGVLGTNFLNGLGMRNTGCTEDHFVNRYELGKEQRITALETENQLLKANIYTDQKISETYATLKADIRANADAISAQAVYNATNTATLGCLQNQVAQLQSMTKMVIPATNVCPQPMPQYNSWTAPTESTTT